MTEAFLWCKVARTLYRTLCCVFKWTKSAYRDSLALRFKDVKHNLFKILYRSYQAY